MDSQIQLIWKVKKKKKKRSAKLIEKRILKKKEYKKNNVQYDYPVKFTLLTAVSNKMVQIYITALIPGPFPVLKALVLWKHANRLKIMMFEIV